MNLFERKKEILEKIKGNIIIPKLFQYQNQNQTDYYPSQGRCQNYPMVDLEKLAEFLALELQNLQKNDKRN